MPDASTVAELIVGFCAVLVNEFGPVQLQLTAELPVSVKFKSSFSHIGELLLTTKVGSRYIINSSRSKALFKVIPAS